MAASNDQLKYMFFFPMWCFIVIVLPAIADTGYTHIGCWKDSSNRAIPQLEGSDPRIKGHYSTRADAINKCYQVAKERKLMLFAVQDGGWCAGASNLNGYNKYGKATNCKNGKGGGYANDVYRITNPTKAPTSIEVEPCADPLELNKCYRFESVNYAGEFIRHQKRELWRRHANGLSNWKDSTYKVVRAVNGNRKYISLEALNVPGEYVRHSGFKGYIAKCSTKDELCRNDASWAVKYGFVKSAYCERTISFESFNYPGYHLRHFSHRVMISAFEDKDLYKKDASWVYREVSCRNVFKCAAP